MDNNGKKAGWLRVAGDAQQIRDRGTHCWRVYRNCVGEPIYLTGFALCGIATPHNNRPGTNPDQDDNGLVAWIDYYGVLSVGGDGVAIITLADIHAERVPE